MKTKQDQQDKTKRTSPRSTTNAGATTKGVALADEGVVSLGISKTVRNRLKIAAAHRGITMKELAEQLLGQLSIQGA